MPKLMKIEENLNAVIKATNDFLQQMFSWIFFFFKSEATEVGSLFSFSNFLSQVVPFNSQIVLSIKWIKYDQINEEFFKPVNL